MPMTTETTTATEPAPDLAAVTSANPTADEDLEQLVRRAEQGDRGVLPALRRALDASPDVWRNYCQLGAIVEASWLQMMSGENVMMLECWRRQVEGVPSLQSARSCGRFQRCRC